MPALDRVRVTHLHQAAMDLWKEAHEGPFRLANDERLEACLTAAVGRAGTGGLTLEFLRSEWDSVVNAEGIESWDEYRTFPRVGRGVALGAPQRIAAWRVFEALHEELRGQGLRTYEGLCHEVAAGLGPDAPFEHVVADEIQDFGPAELRLLQALAGEGGTLFLSGDLGQRIYKGRTSFRRAGIDVRGRSARLRLNYRTTEQIRRYADGILPGFLEDPDGDEQEKRDAFSLFSGPDPEVLRARSVTEEIEKVGAWLQKLLSNGYAASDIAIFARTNDLVERRVRHVVGRLGLKPHLLRDDEPLEAKRIAIGTMHRAKGLEFKAVAVMGCEEGYLPNRFALGRQPDEVERAAFVEQERNLFYVACTRARERLLVSCGAAPSPFLEGPR